MPWLEWEDPNIGKKGVYIILWGQDGQDTNKIREVTSSDCWGRGLEGILGSLQGFLVFFFMFVSWLSWSLQIFGTQKKISKNCFLGHSHRPFATRSKKVRVLFFILKLGVVPNVHVRLAGWKVQWIGLILLLNGNERSIVRKSNIATEYPLVVSCCYVLC